MTQHYQLMQLSLRELFEKAQSLGLTIVGASLQYDAKAKGATTANDAKYLYAGLILNKIKRTNQIRSLAWQVGARCENLYNRPHIS